MPRDTLEKYTEWNHADPELTQAQADSRWKSAVIRCLRAEIQALKNEDPPRIRIRGFSVDEIRQSEERGESRIRYVE